MYKFEKLIVWQESVALIQDVYILCNKLPKIEEKNIIDQLRRATLSISLNIAEGSGAENDKEFNRYLNVAKKSLFELIAILKIIEYLYKIEVKLTLEKIDVISKMLTGLSKYLKTNKLKTKV